jgi:type IV secretory pathway VirB10-like protein
MSDNPEVAATENSDGQNHRFAAERPKRPSKTALLVIAAFVATMSAVGGGVMLVKSYMNDYQLRREEQRREKERLAKIEQQRGKKLFALPGTLPPPPPPLAASAPVEASSALPVNFGATRPQPIEVHDTPRSTAAPTPALARSGNQLPPPPPATMMLSDPAGVARTSNSATAHRPDPSPAKDPAAEHAARMERLIAAAENGPAPGAPGAPGPHASAPASGPPVIPRGVGRSSVQDYAKVSAARNAITSTGQTTAAKLGDRSLLLARGSFVPCVLETQLFTNVPGECRCVLPEDIYSDDGSTVLMEKGSTVAGVYGNTIKPGDSRIAVIWNRIKTVRGMVVEVDSPAADGVGTMGVDGHVDNHWPKRIGAALLLSLIDDAVTIEVAKQSEGATSTARPTSTADTTKSMSEQVLQSTINIPPTITKNRGARLMIYVKRDLWFHDVYSISRR